MTRSVFRSRVWTAGAGGRKTRYLGIVRYIEPPAALARMCKHISALSICCLCSRLQTSAAKMRVAVIGAGPSGLVTLKYLVNAYRSLPTEQVEARLFEVESIIGGIFAYYIYEDAEVGNPVTMMCPNLQVQLVLSK